jgi:hypothetical protein
VLHLTLNQQVLLTGAFVIIAEITGEQQAQVTLQVRCEA